MICVCMCEVGGNKGCIGNKINLVLYKHVREASNIQKRITD